MWTVCFELRGGGEGISVSGSERPPLQEQSGLLQVLGRWGDTRGESWNTSVTWPYCLFTLVYVICSWHSARVQKHGGFVLQWLAFCKVWVSWWVQHLSAFPPTIVPACLQWEWGWGAWGSLDFFFLRGWGGELFWLSLPIRCKFPGTQFILGLLQFVFSLFQFSLHFEEKQVDGWVHHGWPQLGCTGLLDLLEVLNLGLRDETNQC